MKGIANDFRSQLVIDLLLFQSLHGYAQRTDPNG